MLQHVIPAGLAAILYNSASSESYSWWWSDVQIENRINQPWTMTTIHILPSILLKTTQTIP
jgi:hypothetical protein